MISVAEPVAEARPFRNSATRFGARLRSSATAQPLRNPVTTRETTIFVRQSRYCGTVLFYRSNKEEYGDLRSKHVGILRNRNRHQRTYDTPGQTGDWPGRQGSTGAQIGPAWRPPPTRIRRRGTLGGGQNLTSFSHLDRWPHGILARPKLTEGVISCAQHHARPLAEAEIIYDSFYIFVVTRQIAVHVVSNNCRDSIRWRSDYSAGSVAGRTTAVH